MKLKTPLKYKYTHFSKLMKTEIILYHFYLLHERYPIEINFTM